MPIFTTFRKVRIRNFPLATYSLIAFNVLVYVAITRGDPSSILARFGLTPSQPTLQTMFASSFLHRDFAHLLGNLLFLWLFGRKVEQAMGAVEFLLLYVGGGFAASVMHVVIASAFFPPEWTKQPPVGASGPIAAVLGVFVIRFSRHKFHIGRAAIPALPLLFGWLLAQIALGVLGLSRASLHLFGTDLQLRDVGYWAHVGGFIFGMAVAQVTRMAVEGEKEYLRDDAQNSLRRGTLLDVVGKYEALLGYDPTDPFAHAELGRSWALLNDREEAVAYYTRSAQLYLKKGLGDEALTRHDEMLRFWSDSAFDPETQYRLACYLEEVGQYDRAVEILGRVFALYPNSAEAEMAMLKTGQIQFNKLNKPGLAAAILAKFVDRYPNSEWRSFAESTVAKARQCVEDQISSRPEKA